MLERLLERPSLLKYCLSNFKSWLVLCVVLGLIGFGLAAKESKVDYLKNELASIKLRKEGTNSSLPSLIVFNLNYTLWPFSKDMLKPPIEKTKIKHEFKDKSGKRFSMFPEVYVVLEELNRKSYSLAALVDSSEADTVDEVSSIFGIKQFFNFTVSSSETKTEQIKKLSERANILLQEMLYFDSNLKSLKSIKSMNVTGIWVHPQVGFTYPHLEEGLRVFKYTYKIRNNLITTTTLPTLPTRRRPPR